MKHNWESHAYKFIKCSDSCVCCRKKINLTSLQPNMKEKLILHPSQNIRRINPHMKKGTKKHGFVTQSLK